VTISPTSWMLDEIRRAALLPHGADMTDGQLLDCFLARREEAAFEASRSKTR
jgi:hypothetical protein